MYHPVNRQTGGTTVPRIRPSQLVRIILWAIAVRQPMMVWGSPATGKSALVKLVARLLGVPCIVKNIADSDPSELLGLADLGKSRDAGKTVWTRPAWLPDSGWGILFLDEISNAPLAVQAVVYPLVYEGRLGTHTTPWYVIGAGNLEKDRGCATRQSTALANRFSPHVELIACVEEWLEWARYGDNLSQYEGVILDLARASLASYVPATVINAMVQGYITKYPDELHQFHPELNPIAYPTYRSWEAVSKYISVTPNESCHDIEALIINGCIGEQAGSKFNAWLTLFRQMPTTDEVFANPSTATTSDDCGIRIAMTLALARDVKAASLNAMLTYLKRFTAPDGSEAMEYQTLAIKAAGKREPSLTMTGDYIRWAAANSAYTV